MKTITKTAKLALAAILLTFCLACEEKEAKPPESVSAQTETEGSDVKPPESVPAKTETKRSGKVLESITDGNGKPTMKFEYDEQNRIVKKYIFHDDGDTATTMITYANNSVTIKWDNGKNTENYVSNFNSSELNNLSPGGYVGDEYDDKKSPFFNCNSPKGVLQVLFRDEGYESENNVIRKHSPAGDIGTDIYTYKYEYDNDGFPTKYTERYKFEGDDEVPEKTTIGRYIYRGGK
jgi:hypothetical protein